MPNDTLLARRQLAHDGRRGPRGTHILRAALALCPPPSRRSMPAGGASRPPSPRARPSTASIPASASSPTSASRPRDLDRLQVNLIRSHAAGVGAPLPAGGGPGADDPARERPAAPDQRRSPLAGQALVALLNAGLVPAVPEQGSVGASGDLAPLSHVALALMGEGEVLAGWRSVSRPRPALAAAGPDRRSASRRRKGSPSSTAPRRRPPSSPCWSTTPRCSGAPRSARRR